MGIIEMSDPSFFGWVVMVVMADRNKNFDWFSQIYNNTYNIKISNVNAGMFPRYITFMLLIVCTVTEFVSCAVMKMDTIREKTAIESKKRESEKENFDLKLDTISVFVDSDYILLTIIKRI